jgi:hypothetical protein
MPHHYLPHTPRANHLFFTHMPCCLLPLPTAAACLFIICSVLRIGAAASGMAALLRARLRHGLAGVLPWRQLLPGMAASASMIAAGRTLSEINIGTSGDISGRTAAWRIALLLTRARQRAANENVGDENDRKALCTLC